MLPDAHDPRTWVCEWWWPPEWHTNPYAADFSLLREFGLLLLAQEGAWRVELKAADPVAQFVVVWRGQRKWAEVSVDSDGPAPRLSLAFGAQSSERTFATGAEAVEAVTSRVAPVLAEPGATAAGGGIPGS